MQHSLENDGANRFARTMEDLEEQFYKTFPAAREAMMQKHWQLANGYSDPMTDFVYAYDPNAISECPPSHGHTPANDSSLSSYAWTQYAPSPYPSTSYVGNHPIGAASSSSSTSASEQPPYELATILPAPSLGFSEVQPSNIHSSSLSAAVVPVQASYPHRRHSQHQEEERLHRRSVPVVPSNNNDRYFRGPFYPHQAKSSGSTSGWVEPPPICPLDDGLRNLNHYQQEGISVPAHPPQQGRPHTMSFSPEPHRDHHHQRFDSTPASTPQTSLSAPASTHQFVHSGPLVSHGLNVPHVNEGLVAPPHIVPSNDGSPTPPSPPTSIESPHTPTDGDDQASVVQQRASAIVAQPTTSGRSTVGNGSKSAKKSLAEKKPPLACLFCRGRKIACGSPVPGGDDHTCNQCHRRGLVCEYPAESRRGMRRKRSLSDLDGDTKRSSSKSQRTRR